MFFRNMLARGSQPTDFFEIMHILYHGDGRPAFPGHFRWLETLVSVLFIDYMTDDTNRCVEFVTVIGGYIAPMLGYTRKYHTLKKLQ